METLAPTVVCAWCDRLLREGGHGVSHGMCEPCAEKFARSFPMPRRARAEPASRHEPEVSH